MYNLPKQRVSLREKLKVDWYKAQCDGIIAKAITLNDKERTRKCVNAANGYVDSSTFNYVVSPIKDDGNGLLPLPGEIRDVDFVTPIRERHMGEYRQLPYNFYVQVHNPDNILKRDVQLQQYLAMLSQQYYIQIVETMKQEEAKKMQQSGEQLSPEEVEQALANIQLPDFQQVSEKFIKDWIDNRAIDGKRRLELLNSLNDFDFKRISGFLHYWSTEEFYTYRYIDNGELRTEVLNPLDCYPLDNGEEFVEDYDGFVHIKNITINQFIDKYRDEVSEEERKYIDSIINRYTTSGARTVPLEFLHDRFGTAFTMFKDKHQLREGNNFDFFGINENLNVYTVCFKTERLIKILTYINPLGEVITIEVDEDYKLNKEMGDISIEKEWINAVMIMHRFGDEITGVYTKPKYVDVQRRDANNKSICKLPFGGKKGILNGIFLNPVPLRLIPYLTLYKIFTLKIEREVAKFKGDILVLPKSVLASDDSGTAKQKAVSILADNLLTYDNELVDFNTIAQGIRSVGGTNTANYLEMLMRLRDRIKEEAYELSNMNNERLGQSDTKGTATAAQQNLDIARLGSILMTYCYNEALRRDHVADLEWSKTAWANGKTGSFVDKNGIIQNVEVDPEEHNESDYGVFINNSHLEAEKLRAFKDLAFSAAQNGALDIAAKAISIDNVPELNKILDEYSEMTRQMQTQMQQEQSVIEQKKLETQMQLATMTTETDIKVAEINKERAIEVELIKSDVARLGLDLNSNKVDDSIDIEKRSKLRLQEQDMNFKQRMEQEKLQLEREKLASKERVEEKKLKIAKENKNKYDRKK